ncbi:hypothetical protein G7046_g2178 [Stylonectria norvegica]|nr:hypothetical protein G7046_g2178 [Stylonectria norvegica]
MLIATSPFEPFDVFYAHHGIDIECDIYSADEYTNKKPVFLYFHPGGLVDWGRDCLAPWLVQFCFLRKWTLISASYRLMPQVGAHGLLQDVRAAYEFSKKWDAPEGRERHVIVGGASGGFFNAALAAHHCSPPPLALLSISGINTFRHPFFNSSTLLTPTPIDDAEMDPIINGLIAVGVSPEGSPASFVVEKLLDDGMRNPDWKPPQPAQKSSGRTKGDLYDYYIYKNAWVDLLGEIDPGYDWAKDPAAKSRYDKWPTTIILHGDADTDVPLDVTLQMEKCLGERKVSVFVVPGQGHLFELMNFLEDEVPGKMEIWNALSSLVGAVTVEMTRAGTTRK